MSFLEKQPAVSSTRLGGKLPVVVLLSGLKQFTCVSAVGRHDLYYPGIFMELAIGGAENTSTCGSDESFTCDFFRLQHLLVSFQLWK